ALRADEGQLLIGLDRQLEQVRAVTGVVPRLHAVGDRIPEWQNLARIAVGRTRAKRGRARVAASGTPAGPALPGRFRGAASAAFASARAGRTCSCGSSGFAVRAGR